MTTPPDSIAHPSDGRRPWIPARLPGVGLTAALAIAAIALGKVGWFLVHGISALTLAIVLGMLAGNTFYPRIAASSASGVTFSKQYLLRLGIILYRLRLTFQDIGRIGVAPAVAVRFD